MNSSQEAEFHLAVYHYFLWQAYHERANEVTHQQSPANLVSQRYQLVADQTLQQFPHHLSFFTWEHVLQMGLSSPPPVVRNLYIDLPGSQAALFAAQQRIAHLESMLEGKLIDSEGICSQSKRTNKRKGCLGEANDVPSTQRRNVKMKTGATSNRSESLNVANGTASNTMLANDKGAIDPTDAQVDDSKITDESLVDASPSPSKVATFGVDMTKLAKAVDAATVKPSSLCSFEERVKQLDHFRKGNGHCRVPNAGSKCGLGRWVMNVRALYKARQTNGGQCKVLTDERIALLENMGFEWTLKTMLPWEQRYLDLVKYKEQNGHCNVPRKVRLGEFVHLQRRHYRQKAGFMFETTEPGSMSRADLLDQIGFVWDTGKIQTTFEDRLEECREFRRQNNHLSVPVPMKQDTKEVETSESRKDRLFLQWAQRVREQHRKHKSGIQTSLDRSRIRKLDELGFDWDVDADRGTFDGRTKGKAKSRTEAFNDRIAILAQIRDKYGDCNDIKNLRAEGHPMSSSLYLWMKDQRKAWKALQANKSSSLNPERIALLNGVQFNFEPFKHRAPYGSQKSDKRKSDVDAPDGRDAMTDGLIKTNRTIETSEPDDDDAESDESVSSFHSHHEERFRP